MQYKIWNKKDKINGVEASYFLNKIPFKNCNHDIILIYAENGKVSQVECKDILAKHYNIDVNLDIDTFMLEYEKAITIEDEVIENVETN